MPPRQLSGLSWASDLRSRFGQQAIIRIVGPHQETPRWIIRHSLVCSSIRFNILAVRPSMRFGTHEVAAPWMAFALQPGPHARSMLEPQSSWRLLLLRNLQPLATSDPFDSDLFRLPAGSRQQSSDATVGSQNAHIRWLTKRWLGSVDLRLRAVPAGSVACRVAGSPVGTPAAQGVEVSRGDVLQHQRSLSRGMGRWLTQSDSTLPNEISFAEESRRCVSRSSAPARSAFVRN